MSNKALTIQKMYVYIIFTTRVSMKYDELYFTSWKIYLHEPKASGNSDYE